MAAWCGAGGLRGACGRGALLLPEPTLASATDVLQHLPDSRHVAVYHRATSSSCGSTRAPACSSLGTWRCSSRESWTTPPHPSLGRRAGSLTAGEGIGAHAGAPGGEVQSHVPPWSSGRRPDGGDVGPVCPVLTRTCHRQEHRWQQQGSHCDL